MEEFIQHKLRVVFQAYASCGKVWDCEFCCLLTREDGRVIIGRAACMIKMICDCICYFVFVIYCIIALPKSIALPFIISNSSASWPVKQSQSFEELENEVRLKESELAGDEELSTRDSLFVRSGTSE